MSQKTVTVGPVQVTLALSREGTVVTAGTQELEILSAGESEIEIRIDGRTQRVPFAIDGTMISFAFGGDIWFADVADSGTRARQRHRDHSTAAPMPGVVLRLFVRPGERVAKGAPLLILEAMKMEHQVVAPRDGVIGAVHCSEGELVQPGVELVTFEGE